MEECLADSNSDRRYSRYDRYDRYDQLSAVALKIIFPVSFEIIFPVSGWCRISRIQPESKLFH